MLTDTHCHLDLERFDADRPDVLSRARAVGVTRILIPAIDLPSCRRVLALAASDEMLFAAIGIHPTETASLPENWLDELAALFPHPQPLSQRERGWGEGKLVAIGEIGLDYYWQAAPREIQREALRAQLKLAAQTGLPVILHLREKDDALQGEAAADLLELLREWSAALQRENNPLAQRPGVLHSFSGSLETAQAALALGFFLGITGPVTYKNAEARREVVKSLPLERVLIETDSPFLAPVPQRGKRNEPAFVCAIADKIAEIHHLSPPELAAITSENARRLFGWG
ncbi:MAG: TatD family hydrolase [Anaerolineales bacterium]